MLKQRTTLWLTAAVGVVADNQCPARQATRNRNTLLKTYRPYRSLALLIYDMTETTHEALVRTTGAKIREFCVGPTQHSIRSKGEQLSGSLTDTSKLLCGLFATGARLANHQGSWDESAHQHTVETSHRNHIHDVETLVMKNA